MANFNATVLEVYNPFDPSAKHARRSTIKRRMKVRNWLGAHCRNYSAKDNAFYHASVVEVNGKVLMRSEWGYLIKKNDIVKITQLTGNPVVIMWISLAFAAISLVIALTTKFPNPNTGQADEADPVYTLKGQRNQIKLNSPIEVSYGKVRMWPSYAAQPYNTYENNDQYLYSLFCLGQGVHTIHSMQIEDTPIENFSDMEVEVCPPGTPVTLFPDNVVTSGEVDNVELYGPNEDKDDGTIIIDSPGSSEDGIPETTHKGYFSAGPYVANPANTLTTKLQFDVAFARGLYASLDDGSYGPATVTAVFDARRIDNDGNPIGDWVTVADFARTLNTPTPQRYTLVAEVDSGRYEVRAERTNDKASDTSRIVDTFQWERLRAFLPSVSNYGNVTIIAWKAKATNNLNDNSKSRFNTWSTRNLPIWSGTEWSAPTPTRSPIWAYCDAFRAEYGGQKADSALTLAELKTLADEWEAAQVYFDWTFDQKITLWDALKTITNIGRAIPLPMGSQYGIVVDRPASVRSAMFTPEVMTRAGGFRREIKLATSDDYDGLEVTYTDPITWKDETVLCCLDDEEGDDPEKVTLTGCTDRIFAWRWGMYQRRVKRFRVQQIVFTTGMEGNLSTYWDFIGVTHDNPNWGQSGMLLSIADDNRTLELSEPVSFDDPEATYEIFFRRKNNIPSEVYQCVAGATSKQVILTEDITPDDYIFADNRERPIYSFGPENLVTKDCIISNLAPTNSRTVEITATPYKAIVFTDDANFPEDAPDTNGNIPTSPALPSVTGLIVAKSGDMPNEVVASWNVSRGALYYLVQLSYDLGTSWETVGTQITTTSFRFTVLPKFIWVRVAAVTTAAGQFAYWMGDSPAALNNIITNDNVYPNPVTDVVLTAGFGIIWFNWTDPDNVSTKKLKAIHIYITHGSATGWDTKPEAPTFSIRPGQQFWGYSGLPDNDRVNAWFVAETLFGLFSDAEGPHSATTVNGITLDHLIPGGLQPVEIVTTIPSTGNYIGRLVYLTAADAVGADYVTGLAFAINKVYRWEGAGTPLAPVAGKDKWTANSKAVDLSGQIVSDQIADAAILNAKLADNAVSQAKLQDTIVSTAKLVDGAVASAKLADDAVTSAKIATGAVIADSLAAAAVTATAVADDAITTPKILAGAITAAKIGAGEVTAGKLAADSVVAANIQADAVTAVKIQAGAIETAKIAAGAVTTNELAANSVTAAKIGAGEITTAKLAAGAVTTNELAANSVTAAKIGAGEIIAGKIAANAVTATELAADSVTAGKIQAAAVTASAIGANEVIANTANIKDGVITTAKIADAQINNAKIADAAITSAKIGDLEVDTIKIANGAITTAVSAFTSGSISVPDSVWTTIQDLYIDTTGVPVFIVGTYYCDFFGAATVTGGVGSSGPVVSRFYVRILMNGTEISRAVGAVSGSDSPAAGTQHVELQYYLLNAGSVSVENRSLFAIELKK